MKKKSFHRHCCRSICGTQSYSNRSKSKKLAFLTICSSSSMKHKSPFTHDTSDKILLAKELDTCISTYVRTYVRTCRPFLPSNFLQLRILAVARLGQPNIHIILSHYQLALHLAIVGRYSKSLTTVLLTYHQMALYLSFLPFHDRLSSSTICLLYTSPSPRDS